MSLEGMGSIYTHFPPFRLEDVHFPFVKAIVSLQKHPSEVPGHTPKGMG